MSEALAPGAVIFGYQIERTLGRGGMGTVYLARQLSLGRLVALKVLHPSRIKSQKAASEFFREAAATATLSHPSLVAVHDLQADTHLGLYAFSMEYVPGVTGFQQVLEQGPLTRATALTITAQLASALAYAHSLGFVHRDLKPENVIIVDGKTAKLLDLGLAYNRLGSVGNLNERHQSSGRKLMIIGTPDYSAPEQSRNPERATAASDVWGLGATLYYLLTGHAPFDGETIIDLIVSTAMDPLTFPEHVTDDCRQLLELMMAKDPADRLADGAQVLHALQQISRNEIPTLPGQERKTPVPTRKLAARTTATGSGLRPRIPSRRMR